jgi:hypothetical protein
MLATIRKSWLLLVLPLFAVGFFVAALLLHYQGRYSAPPSVHIPFEQLTAPQAPAGDFPNLSVREVHPGTLVVDAAHRNRFSPGELAELTNQVTNRGYQVRFMGDFRTADASVRLTLLEEQLRHADSLAVILPQDDYTPQEVQQVSNFVRKGGKLLLVADPSRSNAINSLAESFGINFQPDYLYNVHEYEMNFRDIFIREFQPDELTQGVNEIILYSAGSVQSSGAGLVFTDEYTRSSLSELDTRFYPLARGDNPNVVAVYDFTFMVPPHNAVVDNNRLLANLAGYLTRSQRTFGLTDFPHFLSQEVAIVLGPSASLEQGTELRNLLANQGIASVFAEVENPDRDTVFLGTYDDFSPVAPYLDDLGVSVSGQLNTPFTPGQDATDTGLLLLHQSLNREVLVLLAGSSEGLSNLITRLASAEFRDGLVDDFVGVYKTQ